MKNKGFEMLDMASQKKELKSAFSAGAGLNKAADVPARTYQMSNAPAVRAAYLLGKEYREYLDSSGYTLESVTDSRLFAVTKAAAASLFTLAMFGIAMEYQIEVSSYGFIAMLAAPGCMMCGAIARLIQWND